ncbi:precorrin-3B [Sesbania bispinosa]|nr:precorrin-3B [Sesbania bispinosa]
MVYLKFEDDGSLLIYGTNKIGGGPYSLFFFGRRRTLQSEFRSRISALPGSDEPQQRQRAEFRRWNFGAQQDRLPSSPQCGRQRQTCVPECRIRSCRESPQQRQRISSLQLQNGGFATDWGF